MKTVIGLFETFNDARATMEDLISNGLQREEISILANCAGGQNIAAPGIDHLETMRVRGIGEIAAFGPLIERMDSGRQNGEIERDVLVTALTDAGVPMQTARAFVEGLQRGGTLESILVEDGEVDRAVEIMRAHSLGNGGMKSGEQRLEEDRDHELGGNISLEGERNIPVEGERKIPVIEEELKVGKRAVEGGGVRIFAKVTERPVEENVQLREEKVSVERRPADRPATGEAFKNETFEMSESSEEPVIDKEARVVEEVVLKKDVTQRSKTVKDTVRKQDVQVEKFNPEKYRANNEENFAARDTNYEQYQPAYKFGHTLRNDERYVGKDWTEVEPHARRSWEEKNPGTWESFKGAVRHAWDKITKG